MISKGGLNKSSRVFFLFGLYPLGRGSAAASCSRCRVSASKFLDDVYINLNGFLLMNNSTSMGITPSFYSMHFFPIFTVKPLNKVLRKYEQKYWINYFQEKYFQTMYPCSEHNQFLIKFCIMDVLDVETSENMM